MTEVAPARGLIQRLGGAERVREILVRFYALLAEDVWVGFFFVGRDLDEIVDGQLRFLMRATGEKVESPARHPADAHRDLPPILSGHFDRRVHLLRQVLGGEGVAPVEIEAWVRIEESMRRVVVSPRSDG